MAMVCPTNCGKIVEARLQVRITFFSPVAFMRSILASNLGSMNGPFFKLRDILPSGYSLPALALNDVCHHDVVQYTCPYVCYGVSFCLTPAFPRSEERRVG